MVCEVEGCWPCHLKILCGIHGTPGVFQPCGQWLVRRNRENGNKSGFQSGACLEVQNVGWNCCLCQSGV